MRTSGKSETELIKASSRKLLKIAWYDATISEASEQESKRGNAMMKLTVVVDDGAGGERTFTDYLTDTAKGGWLLRRACAARGVVEKYDAGEVEQSDLPGPVRLKVGIEKRKGWPDRLKVEDFAARASSVVNLRAAG